MCMETKTTDVRELTTNEIYTICIQDSDGEWKEHASFTYKPDIKVWSRSYPFNNIIIRVRKIDDGRIIEEYSAKDSNDCYIHCPECNRKIAYGDGVYMVTDSYTMGDEFRPRRLLFCSRMCVKDFFSKKAEYYTADEPVYAGWFYDRRIK